MIILFLLIFLQIEEIFASPQFFSHPSEKAVFYNTITGQRISPADRHIRIVERKSKAAFRKVLLVDRAGQFIQCGMGEGQNYFVYQDPKTNRKRAIGLPIEDFLSESEPQITRYKRLRDIPPSTKTWASYCENLKKEAYHQRPVVYLNRVNAEQTPKSSLESYPFSPICICPDAVEVFIKQDERKIFKEGIAYWYVPKKKKWSFSRDPQENDFWKKQIEEWFVAYSQGGDLLKSLINRLKVMPVKNHPHFPDLNGQLTVVTTQAIKKNTIIGLYGNFYYRGERVREKHLSCDQTCVLQMLQKFLRRGKKKCFDIMTRYEAWIPSSRTQKDLIIGGVLGGDMSRINSCRGPNTRRKDACLNLINLESWVFKLKGKLPVMGLVTLRDLKEGEELFVDYGAKYWTYKYQRSITAPCPHKHRLNEPCLIMNNFDLLSCKEAPKISLDDFMSHLRKGKVQHFI